MRSSRLSMRNKMIATSAIIIGALGGAVVAAAPASAATYCTNLRWDGKAAQDVSGTCWVDPGKRVTVKITCHSLPGYVAFTKTKVLRASQSFVWDTGCRSVFYSRGVLSYSVG